MSKEIGSTSCTPQFLTKRFWMVAAFALLLTSVTLIILNPTVQIVQTSLLMALVGCVMLGHLFVEKPSVQSPLPLVLLWKTVSGLCFFYLCCLVYLFFQTREQAINKIVTFVDPKLQLIDYEQVSYAEDCSLTNDSTHNPLIKLYHACFDIFALAHFLGWFFKTLICRDLKLIFFASVTFQLIEYSLRNVLNNFKECWWDHVIIDIFGCNLLGIVCGFFIIDKFGLERYRWSLRTAPLQHTHWKYILKFWTNWDISNLETKAFTSLRPFLKMVLFAVMFQVNDLTLFFLKYIYHIPPNHFLCGSRIWLVGLLCVNATKQYYDFMKLRSKFRKVNLLLLYSIVIMEILIVLKQGDNQFDHAYIDYYGKLLFGSLIVGFFVFFVKIGISDILRKLKARKIKEIQIQKQIQAQYAKQIKQD